MKIIFLNTWNCKVEEPIKEFIKQNLSDTDVFCFQEAYEKAKWIFKDILSDFVLIEDYKHIDDTDNFPQATYVRKNVGLTSQKSLFKDIDKLGFALHTQINYKNEIINICNVHGVSKPGDKQDTPSRILFSQEIIKYYKNLGGLKIIGGDFNLEHNTQSVNLFEENGYINLIKKYKIPTTRNRFVWDKYPDNKQYFSDYVFVSPEVKIKCFDVPNIEVSDHLPIILEIC